MTTLHQSLSASLRNEALEEAAKLCETFGESKWAHGPAEVTRKQIAQAIRSLKTEEG